MSSWSQCSLKYSKICYHTRTPDFGRSDYVSHTKEQVWELGRKACEHNDTTLLDEAISLVPARDSAWSYKSIVRSAIRNNSVDILSHLVNNHGACLERLPPWCIATDPKPSTATLEFLLAHGWNINNHENHHPSYSLPFLWWNTSDVVLVQWCLDHGASVKTPPSRFSCGCHNETILERAANSGSFASFKLLQSKGAPIGLRTLHKAVKVAAIGHTGSEDAEKDTEEQRKSREKHAGRMALVRYLLDVTGLDVNLPDQEPGCTKGMFGAYGTPICYIPCVGMPDRDARELTWLLLDRGADPTPALEDAKTFGHATFKEYVDGWKKERNRKRSEEKWVKSWTERGCSAQ